MGNALQCAEPERSRTPGQETFARQQYQMLRPDGERSLGGLMPSPREGRTRDFMRFVKFNGYEEDDMQEDTDGHVFQGSGTEIEIPRDAYGAAILAIAKDLPFCNDPDTRALNSTVCTFVLCLLGLNVAIQVSVLLYVDRYVVAPSVRNLQEQFRYYRRELFDVNGNFLHEAWEGYEYKEDLCHIALTDPFFYFVILFSWTMTMLVEIRASEKLFRDIRNMPTVARLQDQIETNEDSKFIVGLTSWSRGLILGLVCLPKLVISGMLLWLGSCFLSATNSFHDLVLNSVAMKFITNTDEHLFHAILPQVHRDEVGCFCLFMLEPGPSTPEKERSDRMKAYRRSGLYVLTGLLYVFVYSFCLEDVLPPMLVTVKYHCRDYVLARQQPVCTKQAWWFWFNEDDETGCYPFGAMAPI